MQRAATACGFAFILREEEEAPMPYGSRRRRRRSLHDARRKEAFQHDRIIFRVPREHTLRERNAGRGWPCKSGARDEEGTCPFLYPFRTSPPFVRRRKDRKRVSIVSYSNERPRPRRRPDPSASEFEKQARARALLCGPCGLVASSYRDMQLETQRVHKYSRDVSIDDSAHREHALSS